MSDHTDHLTPELLREAALDLAIAAGQIGNYCDHVEHNETTVREDVEACAGTLRKVALTLAGGGERLIGLYAARIDGIERAKVGYIESVNYSGRVRACSTWRDLQLVQMAHDGYYYQDVVGLSRMEQMRHYALHVAKLTGLLTRASRGELALADLTEQRIPDCMLFSVKIYTALNHKMEDEKIA
jgi:hypothetical protein